MTKARRELTRGQILSYRQTVGALGERLPPGPTSLRRAAWAGLQDSMPRAALLSIHARVHGTRPDTWEDPSSFSCGGRGSAPTSSPRVTSRSSRSDSFPTTPRVDASPTTSPVGCTPSSTAGGWPTARWGAGSASTRTGSRYAAPTGSVLIRWDGARQPTVWTVPPPDVDPGRARLELVRRYLHVFGPGTPAAFAHWAGIRPAEGRAAFDALGGSLTPVRTPVGEAWILSRDEPTFLAPARPAAPRGCSRAGTRTSSSKAPIGSSWSRIPITAAGSGPASLARRRPRRGRDRRDLAARDADITIAPWRRFSRAERELVEGEAVSLPLPGLRQDVRVRWDD